MAKLNGFAVWDEEFDAKHFTPEGIELETECINNRLNVETISALEENESMMKDKVTHKRYETFSELLDELKQD